MAVIINELEIVLDPDANVEKPEAQKANGKASQPETPPIEPQDILTVLDREQRNHLRVMAH